tara:strand:- start:58833 stop:60458 length:1626 start_codon:yes stop_codon:yes gene_type:complete
MKDFILPDIGEGIVECELLAWLVSEGDIIVEDQPVAEVMTDKATVQIPAMYSGKVQKLYYQTGEIAQVHKPLFAMDIDAQGDDIREPDTRELESHEVLIPQTDSAKTNSPVLSEHQNKTPVNSRHIETFILPDIGEGIVECELVKWLVSEGDEIVEDQPVVEVMTDKALVEIPAKYSGTVVSLCYQQGEIAKVHSALFTMQVTEDNRENGTIKSNLSSPVPPANKEQKGETDNQDTRAVTHNGLNPNHKVLASPAVRRVAREQNIELSQVHGSGEKGRILKCDLVQKPVEDAKACTTSKVTSRTNPGQTRVERISGIKAAMAKQMVNSVSTIPHFTVSEEIQMDALMALRAQLKDDFTAQGVKLSFMPFFIKAMSMALKAFPVINSQVNEDCTELTYFHEHNIGMAVDGKFGLMVPNIKGVQDMSLLEIAIRASELIEQARQGRLKTSDLTGGTISISNIGVLGGTVATPVINHPEAAIVALGKIQRLPRFDENDQVRPVNIMHVSWSGDHRIIDGATMVRFNNLWKSYIEQPMTMLSTMR